MDTLTLTPSALEAFVVRAKAATYVGGTGKVAPARTASHDLEYREGELAYRDSYFGGTDFLGQETVHHADRPVWGMNYYGYLLSDDIDAHTAGETIKAALTELYHQNRFLGGFRQTVAGLSYVDENTGDVLRFQGVEHITTAAGVRAYELRYHGGRVLD
ncbi:DUF5680 domain-containing protein [Streptomyces sp. NBC_00690]|uniref:DUF5680 domain-containing protein n=1 Tax=Streptomyces sp. NBC_00690 TaxID=2975808 RepID=UPI002E29BA2F|nr:DUF5680 domain-containing protein [Streptomyces sp. NBC_00690]